MKYFSVYSIIFLFSFLILLPYGHAGGGDVILNGGGRAELNAYTVSDNLNYYTQKALQNAQILSLTMQDIADLKILVGAISTQAVRKYPQFTEKVLPYGFQTQRKWNSDILISYQAIYTSQNLSKSFSEVAIITLATYLYQVSPRSVDQLILCSRKIFSGYKETTQSVRLPLQTMNARLTVQALKGPENYPQLLLRFEAQSHTDLTQYLASSMHSCQILVFSDFFNMSVKSKRTSHTQEALHVMGSFKGFCIISGQFSKMIGGQFIIGFSIVDKMVDMNSIKSQIYQVGELK
jgi:hypothetical protein